MLLLFQLIKNHEKSVLIIGTVLIFEHRAVCFYFFQTKFLMLCFFRAYATIRSNTDQPAAADGGSNPAPFKNPSISNHNES